MTYSLFDLDVDAKTFSDFNKLQKSMDVLFSAMSGKDSGWAHSANPDGSVQVERTFTLRKGMTYTPLTWAFEVTPSALIAMNDRAASALETLANVDADTPS